MSLDTGRAEPTLTEEPQRPPASLTRAELLALPAAVDLETAAKIREAV